jgi:hypothetical protein
MSGLLSPSLLELVENVSFGMYGIGIMGLKWSLSGTTNSLSIDTFSDSSEMN